MPEEIQAQINEEAAASASAEVAAQNDLPPRLDGYPATVDDPAHVHVVGQPPAPAEMHSQSLSHDAGALAVAEAQPVTPVPRDPEYIAADLLSQAEHDEMALCLLLTDSAQVAGKVRTAVQRRMDSLPRGARERSRAAIAGQGGIVIVRSIDEALRISNRIAPEHLEILTADPLSRLAEIRNAGSIFLGPFTPEPLGDYLAGPNHVLPTGGTARFFSTLGVPSFLKRSNVLCFSRKDASRLGGDVARFARLEGLEAHARSMTVRKGR